MLAAWSALYGLALATPANAAPAGHDPAPLLSAGEVAIIPADYDIAGTPADVSADEPVALPAPDLGNHSASLPQSLAAGPSDEPRIAPADRDNRYRSFGSRVGAVKWEAGAILAVLTATNIGKVIKDPQALRFQDEGFFGLDTDTLGVDKLAHSYNTYLFSEILYRRMARKTGGGAPSAITAAVLGVGIQFYGEIYDGLHKGSGFSLNDTLFNVAGASFSALRNSVPGLKQKVDFRISIVPNHEFYTFQGKEHFEQERFLLAVKPAGFAALAHTPLRLLEFHVGYYARDFTLEDRANGVIPQRKPFVGIGVNFGELFFKRTRSPVGRGVRTFLEYFQLPYTSLKID